MVICNSLSGIALSVANVAICDFFSWLATEIGYWQFFWRLDFALIWAVDGTVCPAKYA
jgi:hypothetical protein